MRQQQGAARLHERPHTLGPGVGPAVAADEHGVADLRIEERFPGRVAGHVGGDQVDQRPRGGQIAADHDRVAAGGGGGNHLRDPGVDAKKSESHAVIVPRRRSSDQPGPVQPGPA